MERSEGLPADQAFRLFRNSGKSDLMSNIRKIRNQFFFLKLKDRYLIDNKNVNISTEIQVFSFHWMMNNISFNVSERPFWLHRHQNSLNFNQFMFISLTINLLKRICPKQSLNQEIKR